MFAFRITALIMLSMASGPAAEPEKPIAEKSFHEKLGWKAKDYFADEKVVELCEAIERNDLQEIDRLVEDGADANAKGKGNMTPLLWAFPDGKLGRFKRLLEHGADPNVITTSDFGTRGSFAKGESVTHMACKTGFEGYFDAVFDHGGDPNLVAKHGVRQPSTPLFTVMDRFSKNRAHKVRRLLGLGADINFVNGLGNTPVMWATSGGHFDLALILLENKADIEFENPWWGGGHRLVHYVESAKAKSKLWTADQKKLYEKLVAWMEDHGESMEDARKDMQRFRSRF